MLTRIALLLFIPLASVLVQADPPQSNERLTALEQQLRDDIRFLSSEDLRGRGVDDPESIAKAAQYIADRMQAVGLNIESVRRQAFSESRRDTGSSCWRGGTKSS